MKQVDYNIKNQEYSLGQFRNVPEYLALSSCDADSKDKLQTNVRYLLNSTSIDKASGFLLDYIGWLVGTDRKYFDLSNYFCVNKEDVNEERYIYFRNQENSTSTLQDELFRNKIKARASSNHSKCTREENIKIIKYITNAETVVIENVAPLMLDITISGANLLITDTTRDDIESFLGSGVGIRNLEVDNGTE